MSQHHDFENMHAALSCLLLEQVCYIAAIDELLDHSVTWTIQW